MLARKFAQKLAIEMTGINQRQQAAMKDLKRRESPTNTLVKIPMFTISERSAARAE